MSQRTWWALLTLVLVGLAVASLPLIRVAALSELATGLGAFAGIGVLIGVVLLYLLPTLIASRRQHHQAGPITVINMFLGWTFLGWVVALASAASHIKPVQREPPPQAGQPGPSQPQPPASAHGVGGRVLVALAVLAVASLLATYLVSRDTWADPPIQPPLSSVAGLAWATGSSPRRRLRCRGQKPAAIQLARPTRWEGTCRERKMYDSLSFSTALPPTPTLIPTLTWLNDAPGRSSTGLEPRVSRREHAHRE